jgi:hypothetical protein
VQSYKHCYQTKFFGSSAQSVGRNDVINGLMENATFATSPTGVFLFEIFFKSRKTGGETRKERQRPKMI